MAVPKAASPIANRLTASSREERPAMLMSSQASTLGVK